MFHKGEISILQNVVHVFVFLSEFDKWQAKNSHQTTYIFRDLPYLKECLVEVERLSLHLFEDLIFVLKSFGY